MDILCEGVVDLTSYTQLYYLRDLIICTRMRSEQEAMN